MSESVPVAADLLLHREFLTRIARDLVGDAAGADELAQDVWVHALQHPPRHRGALRGWLSVTARNLWSNSQRGERRRLARERAAARPEAPAPSPAEVLQREALRQQVVQAVLRLEEPFRSAVLLRYYEGLEPRVIAARLAVPAATVRTRIARGLERLRRDLDSGRGDRRAWVPTLMVSAMMKPTLAILAALLLLAVGVGLWSWSPTAPSTAAFAEASGGAAVAAPASAAATPDQDATRPEVRQAVAAVSVGATGDRRAYPAERARGVLVGVVVDEVGAVQAGVRVELEPFRGDAPPMLAIADDRAFHVRATTDSAGRFAFDDLPSGPVRVAARAGEREAEAIAVVAAAPNTELVLQLDQRYREDAVVVTVVDDRSGAPVVGARVELNCWLPAASTLRAGGDPAPQATATSGADGVARFEPMGLRSTDGRLGVVFAWTDDGRCCWLGWRGAAGKRLRLRLGPAGAVAGTLTGAPPEALEGATVSLLALECDHTDFLTIGRRFDAVVRGGAFRFDGLPAGTYGAVLAGAGALRLRSTPMQRHGRELAGSVAMPEVAIAPGATAEVTLAVQPGGRLEGIVVDRGRPVAGASVHTVLAPPAEGSLDGFRVHGTQLWRFGRGYVDAPRNPVAHGFARTDGDGRYVLDALPVGELRVEVAADGLSFDAREGVAVRAGETTSLRHDLEPAGVLQVALREDGRIGVQRPGEAAPRMLVAMMDGCATFPGLAAGRWLVQSFGADENTPPELLAEATVEAGRTTWLDLRRHRVGAVLTGRVLAGAAPVEGALLWLGRQLARSDGRGEFRLASDRPLWFRDGDGLTLVVRVGSDEYQCVPTADDPVVAADLPIQLGTRRLRFEVLDADGRPVPARIDLVGETGARPIRAYSTSGRTDGMTPLETGPLPPAPLRGTATCTDGLEIAFAVAADATGLVQVRRPHTVAAVVHLSRRGAPLRRSRVFAWTWRGSGPAPADDDAFLAEASPEQTQRADEQGRATLQVEPGEVLFAVETGFLQQTRLRRTIAPGAEARVDLDVP